jgi:hypothetical protein
LTEDPGIGLETGVVPANRTERCLLNSFASQTIPPYNGLGPNSNTFAAAMLGECNLVGDFPWNAVGSGYSGP